MANLKNPETPEQGRPAWVLWLRALAVMARITAAVVNVVAVGLLATTAEPAPFVLVVGFAVATFAYDSWQISQKAFERGVDHVDWYRP